MEYANYMDIESLHLPGTPSRFMGHSMWGAWIDKPHWLRNPLDESNKAFYIFSYSTPIAYYTVEKGWRLFSRDSIYQSNTTRRHMNIVERVTGERYQ